VTRLRDLDYQACRLWLRLALTLALVIVVAEAASAGEQSVVLAQITFGSSSLSSEHVFGGRTIPVRMTLYGPQDTRADLRARLFQLSSGLVAPVGTDRDVASDVNFGRGLRQQLTFNLEVPAVQRESHFEAVILARAHPAGEWRRLGSASFRAYPSDLLKPLKRWSEDRPLRVHDPSQKLERFLTAQGISFLDPNARTFEKSTEPLITLVVGGADALALAKRRAERGDAVMLFMERAVAFPRIERARGPRGAMTIVELELLDRLPTDPQAQKLFLELITSTQTRETTAQEDN